jgi:hypothetical protein
MISKDVLKTQVSRLLRLPFVPREPADMKGLADEYKRALVQRCQNDGQCKAVVDSLVDTTRERLLTSGDILAAVLEVNGPMGFTGCDGCNYSGWVLVTGKDGYDYSRPCPRCRPSLPQAKLPGLTGGKLEKFDGRAAAAGTDK